MNNQEKNVFLKKSSEEISTNKTDSSTNQEDTNKTDSSTNQEDTNKTDSSTNQEDTNKTDSSTNQEDIFNVIKEINFRDNRIIELEALLKKIKDREKENALRAKAEIENMNRRHEQNIEKIRKFSLEIFITELLPVIDNLERALSVLDKNNPALQSTITGINLTLKSFLDVTSKFGLESVEEKDVPFDPDLHQAMKIIESKEYLDNQIISIMQKGYKLNGRLIRPAMVIVSKKIN